MRLFQVREEGSAPRLAVLQGDRALVLRSAHDDVGVVHGQAVADHPHVRPARDDVRPIHLELSSASPAEQGEYSRRA